MFQYQNIDGVKDFEIVYRTSVIVDEQRQYTFLPIRFLAMISRLLYPYA